MAKRSKYEVSPEAGGEHETKESERSSPPSEPPPAASEPSLPKLYAPGDANVITTQSPPLVNPRLAKGYKESKPERELRRAAAKRIADVSRSVKGVEWSEDQLRLTYLISLYSHWATSPEERERAIRRMPLLVFCFEGIIAQVFDYDYAPTSERIGARKIWLNVSQEARDDLDDLMEFGLIKGFRSCSEEGMTEAAYQVAPRGLDALKELSEHGRSIVNQLCRDPSAPSELLEVRWLGDVGAFELVSANGYRRGSAVTEAEDVSYVSSPYIPDVLRAPYAPALTSYAGRAGEAAKGVSTLRDELAEVLHLANVRCLLGEWIPFGSNHVVALNEKLGSGERIQGGMFSAMVDRDVAGTQAEVSPGLTAVKVLDSTPTRHVNVEASIDYPEAAGIVQIENFGVSVRESGSVFYGARVESVMDRVRDKISIDLLSRLLVDVQQDSSQLVDNLLSPYQRSVLDIVYMGSALQRSKVAVIFAESISPRMLAEKYLDREDNENELKQVLGDTHSAHNIASDEIVIIGERGILLAGPKVERHERLIVAFLGWWGMDQFIRAFFKRLFHLNTDMNKARDELDSYQNNPSVIDGVRAKLREAAQHVIRMEETLAGLEVTLSRTPEVPEQRDDAGRSLVDVLDVESLRADLVWRVRDLARHVRGARSLLEVLSNQTMVVQETLLGSLRTAVRDNHAKLEALHDSSERSHGVARVACACLAGLLSFGALDRLLPRWWNLLEVGGDVPAWVSEGVGSLLELPAAWLVLSMLAWAVATFFAGRWSRSIGTRDSGGLLLRVAVDLPINTTALRMLLQDKPVHREVTDLTQNGNIKRVCWREDDKQKWLGTQPEVELVFDEKRGALMGAKLQATRGWRRKDEVVRVTQLRKILFKELEEASVLQPP